MKKIKYLIVSSIILVCIFLINAIVNKITSYNVLENVSKTFLSVFGIYRDEVNYFEFSDDIVYIGSWYEWKDKNEFEVTIGINSKLMVKENNKDIIFMIDTSSSMDGEKIDIVKELVYYVSYDVLENENNNVSLITFNDTANLLCDFTNDITLIDEKLGNVEFNNDTNYNLALKKLDELLNSYEYSSDRELSVLFITDGNASKETNNHASTYKMLKEKYPYLNISGVLFEKGLTGKLDINDVTDKWILSSGYETVNPVLELLNVTDKFENINFSANLNDEFEIISYNSYSGKIDVIDNKFVWNMSNKYISGSTELLTLRLRLKESIFNNLGHYKLFDSTNISYKLLNGEDRILNTNGSLIVTNGYTVHYDLNLPSGCSVSKINDKKYILSSVVSFEEELHCPGYKFLGYKTKDIDMINDKMFIMPANNVVINAVWAKNNVSVELDGKIREKITLYNKLEELSINTSFVKRYTGEHKDSFTLPATHDIYHFYAYDDTSAADVLANNNVLFANHCWQMIRTTDTGGVKMIYNGEVDSNGKCGSDRGSHVGYNGSEILDLSSEFYYGTDYTYDSITNTFSLDGEKELVLWSYETSLSLIGKYTCMSSEENGNCSTLYLIESANSWRYGNAIKLTFNSNYSQFGKLEFDKNENFILNVGYMYGDIYEYNMLASSSLLNYKYGSSFTSDGNSYTLVDAITLTDPNDINILNTHHYFCLEENMSTCSSVGYIYYSSTDNFYYVVLKEDDKSISDVLDKTLRHNKNDSLIKFGIDSWFEKYLINYIDYLENAIYCNDRSYYNISTSGWNDNGGNIKTRLQFSNYKLGKNLKCALHSDMFSIDNSEAKLDYSIGLPTSSEMYLLNNEIVRKTNSGYWFFSPYYISGGISFMRVSNSEGDFSTYNVNDTGGVRPIISLKSDIEYTGGDGSTDSPYVIE